MKLFISILILAGVLFYSYQSNSVHSFYNPNTIELESTKGKLTLEMLSDKIVILYFGFLSCPDFCPTTLSKISKLLKDLPIKDQNKYQIVFIDLDPKRDDLKSITEYLSFFSKEIIGARIHERQLLSFAQFFKIKYRYFPLNSELKYTVDHSTDLVLYSPSKKQILEKFSHSLNTTNILESLKKY